MSKYEGMNEMHMDVLKEIGNIGAGNAATSLSLMLGRTVDMSVPKVALVEFDELTHILGGPEKLIAGIMIDVFGDLHGTMMFLLEQRFIHEVISTLLGQEKSTLEDMSEMDMSVIQEIGNILAASYINSISQLTGLVLNISIPGVSVDMVGAVLSVPIIRYGAIGDQVLFIDGIFVGEDSHVETNLIFILEDASLSLIMERLGVHI